MIDHRFSLAFGAKVTNDSLLLRPFFMLSICCKLVSFTNDARVRPLTATTVVRSPLYSSLCEEKRMGNKSVWISYFDFLSLKDVLSFIRR